MILLSAALNSPALAELPPPYPEFEHLTPRDGLSNPVVYDIIQDRHGFLWFSTGSGLNRYDGYEFKTYLPDATDPNAIGKGLLLKLFIDSKERLWITSFTNGLFRYDEERDHFIRYHPEAEPGFRLPGYNSYCIDEDDKGFLWISYFDIGLVRLNPETGEYTHFRHEPGNPNSLSSDSILAVHFDSRGKIWASSQKDGLDILDPVTGKITHHLKGKPHAVNIIEDRFNDVWIPTMGEGVIRYIRKEDRFVSYTHDDNDPGSISHNQVINSIEDSHGKLWLTTWGGGINLYDRERDEFISYTHNPADPKSLNSNNTWGLFQDKTGVMWIGTYGAGINTYDPKKERFGQLRHIPGVPATLPHNSVKAVCEDDQGFLWIGTLGGGLSRYDRASGAYRHFRHDPSDPNSLGHDNIWKIVRDRKNRLWIATENGLDMYDTQTDRFLHFRHDPNDPKSIASNLVRTVFADNQGRIWTGNQLLGFDRYDEASDRFIHYRAKGAHNTVIFQDSANRIWATNQHFYHYDPTRDAFIPWEFPPGKNRVRLQGLSTSMAEAPDRSLWIGTSSGLFRFDPERNTISVFGKPEGLMDDAIADLVFDRAGRLWISSGRGLSVMDILTHKIRNYELGSFNRDAGLAGMDGTLFFGGLKGLTWFRPDNIPDNPHLPNVVITSFKKMNQEAGLPFQNLIPLELTYEDRFFSFEFSALDFSDPEKNRYRYRMIGFNQNWITVDYKRRFASYTNLDPGRYEFQVQGTNNDGLWSRNPTRVQLTITPPWWESTFFYFSIGLLCLFIIMAAIWYMARLKFEISERRNAEKSLRISEQRYRHLFDHAPAGMFEIDFKTRRFTEANAVFCEYTGRSQEELMSMDPFDLFTPASRKEADLAVNRFLSGKELPKEVECHITARTKEELCLVLNIDYIYKEKQLEGARMVAHNITDRKQMEEMIIQSEKMMSVGGLAAGMAHELNNPLAGMMQNAQVVLNRITRDLPANKKIADELGLPLDRIQEYMEKREIISQVETIHKVGIRAARLIRNMLSFSRKNVSASKPVQLDRLMDKTIELAGNDYDLKKKYDFRQIQVIREYQPSLPEIPCDPSKIQQVIFNILKNASQAMQEHNSPDNPPRIVLRLTATQTHVKMEIQDNGPGIEEEIRKRIFEPFFTTKEEGSGTGLGLSVSYFIIVDHHKGEMDVKSAPGRGTTFIIKLPNRHERA